jgi:hypothetical protein
MGDTSISVYRKQVQNWLSKSFAERMRLGWEADAAGLADAMRVVRSRSDDLAALFLALHGDQFEEPQRTTIAKAIRSRLAGAPPRGSAPAAAGQSV